MVEYSIPVAHLLMRSWNLIYHTSSTPRLLNQLNSVVSNQNKKQLCYWLIMKVLASSPSSEEEKQGITLLILLVQSMLMPIVPKEGPPDVGALTTSAFGPFCLPWGILRKLEWCIYQVPGFERAHWEDVLHSNNIPEDYELHVLRRLDKVERHISSQYDGVYHRTLILLPSNIPTD